MKLELSSKKPPAQEAADVKKKETVLMKATPKCKSEKLGMKHVEDVDSSSEYTLDSDIEEGESEAYEENDEEVKTPEENEKDLKALREEKSQDLAKKDLKALEKKKREEKEPSQKKPQPVGFTPGAVANFTQALIMQTLEEIKSIDGTLALLDRDHPARKALEETVTQKKEEIKKIQAERQKARDRKHSVRQEMDKKEAGSRVAYIKERQRKRAAEHRKSGFKARVIANVAREEEAERRFNQLDSWRKVKTFPLAERELSKEVQAVPLSKTFLKDDQDEECPEVKRRSMELPPGEKRRLEEKKAKFKEDKASKKSKTQQKRKEDQLLKELKEESAKKKKKRQEEKKEKPIVTPEDEEEAEVQALLAEVGKSSGQASGSAGSAHQDRQSMADTSKYYGGSSKSWSSKWKGNWDKQSYWEHDQWENYYSSGRGSEQPKSPEKGPKKEKEADESEENLEESPKRPKINFDDRRVAGPLRIDKGRMGPPSSEETQEGDDVGLEGLDPTDDELRESTAHAEVPKEEDDEILEKVKKTQVKGDR